MRVCRVLHFTLRVCLERLTILAEESTSRPASAFYLREPEPLCQEQDEDQVPIAEEEDDEPITVITGNQRPPTVEITDEAHEMNALGDNPGHFMSMEFIQMNSQELAYESKPKTAKVIGKYVLGDMIGEGRSGVRRDCFAR